MQYTNLEITPKVDAPRWRPGSPLVRRSERPLYDFQMEYGLFLRWISGRMTPRLRFQSPSALVFLGYYDKLPLKRMLTDEC